MVATARAVEPRRPAELAPDDHQHAVGQPPVVEVFDQRRHGGVERRDLLAAALGDRGVVVPVPLGDRDERHARLDQPAGQQAALADPGPAVAVAEPGVLAREVERLAGRGAGDHLVGLAR